METNLRAKKRITLASPKLALKRVAHLRQVFRDPQCPVKLNSWAQSLDPVAVENHCGTPACFGGHVLFEFAPVGYSLSHYDCYLPNQRCVSGSICSMAANLLGVPEDFADFQGLFNGHVDSDYRGLTERQEALRRLDLVEAYLRGKLAA